jgi:hypothetical protein
MRQSRLRWALFLGAVATLLAVMPVTVFAAKPGEHIRFNFHEAFEEEVCGIPVEVEVTGHVNVLLYFDEEGNFLYAKDLSQFMTTFTNPETGLSVTRLAAGPAIFYAEIVNEDGTVTTRELHIGLLSKLTQQGQGVLLRDAGMILIETTVAFPEEGEPYVVDQEFPIVHGPHPTDAGSDFTLLCEVFTDALT